MLGKLLKNKINVGLTFIFAILLGIFVGSIEVKAEDASVHFGSTGYTTTEGQSFPVGVYINTESGTGQYVVTVTYDPIKLQYLGGADGADIENGVLAFVGDSGGPEIKYMVNFSPIGEASDSAISIASAEVYAAETGESYNTAVAGAAPVSVTPAPAEEEEEVTEEEITEQTDEAESDEQLPNPEAQEEADEHIEEQIQEPVEKQFAEQTEDLQEEKAEKVEPEKSVIYNSYFVIGVLFIGIIILIQLLAFLINHFFGEKLRQWISRDDFDYIKEDDDLTLINLDDEDDDAETAVDIVTDQILKKLGTEENEEEAKILTVNRVLGIEEQEKSNTDIANNTELVKETLESSKPVIAVEDVTMEFHIASAQSSGIKDYIIKFLKREITYRKLFALNHVSFDIYKGEIVGIIGTNGSGKSTLLKIVSGALKPTEGEVRADRKKIQLLTLGTGFDMELTGKENVYLNGAIIGYSKAFLDEHYDEIVKFAELEDFMDEKVKNYSSGMVSRLGFAIATAGDAAEILILDEVLSVGDEFFRKKSLARVKEMIHGGSTVLLVSHSMDTIVSNCTKCVWIEKGELRMVDEPRIVCEAYRNMRDKEAS